MAHYLAELIQDAEKSSTEERPAKIAACCDAILNVWKHRHVLPDGRRPFEALEPFLQVLESLDLESDMPRYYRSVRSVFDRDGTDENEKIEYWLNLIDGIDYSAKVLIRYCLTQAAQGALNKSTEWTNLAKAAGVDEGVDFSLIRLVFKEDSMFNASDLHELNNDDREKIEDRIVRLEEFAKMVMIVVSDLRQKGQQTKSDKG